MKPSIIPLSLGLTPSRTLHPTNHTATARVAGCPLQSLSSYSLSLSCQLLPHPPKKEPSAYASFKQKTDRFTHTHKYTHARTYCIQQESHILPLIHLNLSRSVSVACARFSLYRKQESSATAGEQTQAHY